MAPHGGTTASMGPALGNGSEKLGSSSFSVKGPWVGDDLHGYA